MCRTYFDLAVDFYLGDIEPEEVNISRGDNPTQRFTDLINGETYRVEIECRNVAGWSGRTGRDFIVGSIPRTPILYEDRDCRVNFTPSFGIGVWWEMPPNTEQNVDYYEMELTLDVSSEPWYNLIAEELFSDEVIANFTERYWSVDPIWLRENVYFTVKERDQILFENNDYSYID